MAHVWSKCLNTDARFDRNALCIYSCTKLILPMSQSAFLPMHWQYQFIQISIMLVSSSMSMRQFNTWQRVDYFFLVIAFVATPESTAGKAIAGCRGSRWRKRGSRFRALANHWATCACENWCLTMSTGVSVPWSLAIKRTMCTKCTRE
jgi:hypothetical protein